MTVGVAGHASPVQSQVRFVWEGREPPLNLGAPDVLFRMTLFTPNRCVFSGQRESAFRMIEFRFLKTRDLRILPKMFPMAGYAGAAGILKMEPVFRIDLFFDFGMTRETLGTADPRAALVTL